MLQIILLLSSIPVTFHFGIVLPNYTISSTKIGLLLLSMQLILALLLVLEVNHVTQSRLTNLHHSFCSKESLMARNKHIRECHQSRKNVVLDAFGRVILVEDLALLLVDINC